MRKWMLCCLGVLLMSGMRAWGATGDDVAAQTRVFLDAYARGDRATVMSMAAPEIVFYGSDVAEVFRGSAALKKMIDDDQKLWNGTAKVGRMEEVSVVRAGELAVIVFQAEFTVGDRAAVPVRFAMTWRKMGGRWLLVQSSNAVPTRGQSARELLGG